MNARHSVAALAVVVAGAVAGLPMLSQGQVLISVNVAPPALPEYEQPDCPGDGYLWTPGYWAWDASVADFYWVPGTWVEAPQVGYLWTPGYWGYANGAYLWNVGYWGPHIGFYGGVNYGFGYFGAGYEGGYWNGGHFFYNTAINRVNGHFVHNTYVHNVTVVNTTRVAFNGGPGGTMARPGAGEQAALRENHAAPTGAQTQHAAFARTDRGQFAGANHGQPAAAAMARPAQSASSFHSGGAAPGMQAGGGMNRGLPTNNGGAMQQRNGFANTTARPGSAPATIQAPSGGFLQQRGAQTTQPAAARGGFSGTPGTMKTIPITPPASQQHAAPQQHEAPQQHAAPAARSEEHR